VLGSDPNVVVIDDDLIDDDYLTENYQAFIYASRFAVARVALPLGLPQLKWCCHLPLKYTSACSI